LRSDVADLGACLSSYYCIQQLLLLVR
jgi:hypothetical protein